MFKLKSLSYTPHFIAIGILLVCILFVTLAFTSIDNDSYGKQVEKNYYEGQTRVIIDNSSYILQIQDDNSMILKDLDGRIVHTFNRSSYPHNTNIFDVVDKDNE